MIALLWGTWRRVWRFRPVFLKRVLISTCRALAARSLVENVMVGSSRPWFRSLAGWRAMSAPGSETGLEMVQARLEGAPHNVPEAVAEVEGSRPRPAPGDQFPPSAPPHAAAQGPPGEVGDTKGATNEGSIEIDMNEEMCTGAGN
eukprot:evm.model.scf_258.1 EVM.evm.TU.scf_258.1   scf_258:25343-27111(+)